jgi:hypothetical protein
MRPLLLVALTCSLGACSADSDVGFTLRAVLNAETDGVKLHDDGATGHAAMADQLCLFDLDHGAVLDDIDLARGHETLLDADGDRTLARVRDLHVVPTDGSDGVSFAVDALDARLLGDEVVAVVAVEDSCAATWLAAGVEPMGFVVPGMDCSGEVGFAVDRSDGAVWIADGRVLTRIDRTGAFVRHDVARADRVSWDASTRGVVVGAHGGDWVQGVTVDGDVAWSRTLDGRLADLDVAGDAGVSAIMLSEAAGGALELVDSETGEPTAVHPLPSVAEMTFSNDGRDLALVLPDSVYLYDVDTDVTLWDTPSVSRAGEVNAWVGPGLVGGGAGTTLGVAIAVALLVD